MPPTRPLRSIPRRFFRRAFTTLELLVVAVTVTAMAVLLIPAVSSARATALTAQCEANLKQLGVGTQTYISSSGQLPGMNHQEAWVRGGPWGGNPAILNWGAGGPGAWTPSDGVYLPWAGGIYGAPVENRPSWYSGIGYVWPYISGNADPATAKDDPNARTFYCPANPASFEAVSDGWPGRGYSIYDTWRGTGFHPDEHGFGVTSRASGAAITYYWRGIAYELDTNLPDNSPNWGSGGGPSAAPNWHPGYVTISGRYPRPDDAAIQNKPCLIDWWVGYSVIAPNTSPYLPTVPHRGRVMNSLWTDGSAKTWKLPNGTITAVDPYDRAVNAAAYRYDTRISQTPWIFILTKRAFQ